MAEVNSHAFKRDNALLGYGKSVKYIEAAEYPDMATAIGMTSGLISAVGVFALPPLRSRLLPAPGEGQSESQQLRGFLEVDGVAISAKTNTQVRGTLYVPHDPGYMYTARMLAETGMGLLKTPGGEGVPAGCPRAGVVTPVAALGDVLMERLRGAGIKFEFLDGQDGGRSSL